MVVFPDPSNPSKSSLPLQSQMLLERRQLNMLPPIQNIFLYRISLSDETQIDYIMISHLQQLLPKKKFDFFGSHSLLKSIFPYYKYSLVLFLAILYAQKYPWLFLLYSYVIIPLIDELVSLDKKNPTKQEIKELENNNFWYQIPVYLVATLDWILFFKVVAGLSQVDISIANSFNLIGLILYMFGQTAGGFLTSHQIMHKQSLFNKAIGIFIMTKSLYIHFYYEHCFGHHRRVATPQDPATGRFNETVFEFVPRSFLGGYRSVYEMEKEEGRPFFMNFAVVSVAAAFAFVFGMYLLFGLQGCLFSTLIGLGSIFYLEVINYVEHYGLLRKKLANGSYEKVTIHHSWNASMRYSNYILFKIQRHSDHHENAQKPYQTLQSYEESPQLPHGYTLMFIMATHTKAWFDVMNPITEEYQKLMDGGVKSQVVQKAHRLCREFMIQNSIAFVGLWLVSLAI